MTPPAAAGAVAPRPARERPRLAPGVRRARRVSGPLRRPAPPARERSGAIRGGGALLGALWALERASSHRLLERMVRGRAWLGLVTFALIGIVTLQLALLKLNGGVGRDLQREAALQRENATLAIENSELAATGRVQSHAAQLGMEFAPSSALRFLTSNPALDLRRSASVLSTPAHTAGAGGESSASGGSGEGGEHGAQASSAEGGEHAGAQSESHGEGGEGQGGQGAGGEAPARAAAPASGGEATEASAPAAPAGPAPGSSASGGAGGAQASPSG
jgi:hypothetical protein